MILRAGVHPKVVSERLSQNKVATTLNTDSHILPTLQEEAVELLAETFRETNVIEPADEQHKG